MKRILVAVDGSDPSLKAARMAADIALRFGAKLTLVHVVPKLLLPPDVYGLTIAEVEKEHRAYADRLLEKAVVDAGRAGARDLDDGPLRLARGGDRRGGRGEPTSA